MTRAMVVGGVVMLMAGAATADGLFEWKQPTLLEAAPLVIAELLIAVDVVQTLDWQRQVPSWNLSRPSCDLNPAIGCNPSRGRIVLVGAAGGVALAAAWYALPSGWRAALPIGFLPAELGVVLTNEMSGFRFRF